MIERMPNLDTGDLTAAEITAYQRMLKDLIVELQANIDASKDFTKPVDLDEPIGRISRIDAIAVQQMAKENRHRAQNRVRAAKAALVRIERDDFGFCVVCDEAIGRPRLNTRPESAACVRCQSISEKRR
jgi:DnaK suppressor protein